MKVRTFKTHDPQWAFVLKMGGSEWLRAVIDEKMRDSGVLIEDEIEVLRSRLAQAETMRVQLVGDQEDRRTAAFDELVHVGRAWDKEKYLVDWLGDDSPAGVDFRRRHRLTAAEILELVRLRRGTMEAQRRGP